MVEVSNEKKDDYFMSNEVDPIKELSEQLSGERCAKWSEWLGAPVDSLFRETLQRGITLNFM